MDNTFFSHTHKDTGEESENSWLSHVLRSHVLAETETGAKEGRVLVSVETPDVGIELKTRRATPPFPEILCHF